MQSQTINHASSRDVAVAPTSASCQARTPLALNRILVVVDEDTPTVEGPDRNALLSRAATVARATGATMELFQVCFEPTLTASWTATDSEANGQRRDYLDTKATRLAEFAIDLKADTGADVHHEARWDRSEADAIIRKAVEVDADLIMKTSSQSNYVVGLLTNTDWELIRRSPAHIWFVTGDVSSEPRNLLAAIGNRVGNDDIYGADDYDICDLATLLSSKLGADSTVVHAIQAPPPSGALGHLGPDPTAAAMAVEAQVQQRRDLRREHLDAIKALADYFALDPSAIKVVEGRPDDVITQIADATSADTIVMGAASLGRLERLLRPVSAEPVLARAECDVVFVRPHVDPEDLPDTQQSPVSGSPPVDLEQAVIDPDQAFDHAPARLADESRLSLDMRLRLLKIWENDLRAEMTEEDEGGPTRPSRANLLAQVRRAREALSG